MSMKAREALAITNLSKSAPTIVVEEILPTVIESIKLHASFRKTKFLYCLRNSSFFSRSILLNSRHLLVLLGKRLLSLGYKVRISLKKKQLEISWDQKDIKIEKVEVEAKKESEVNDSSSIVFVQRPKNQTSIPA